MSVDSGEDRLIVVPTEKESAGIEPDRSLPFSSSIPDEFVTGSAAEGSKPACVRAVNGGETENSVA